jgi:hypothetical protein
MQLEDERRLRLYYMAIGVALVGLIEGVAHTLRIWEVTYPWWWFVTIFWGAMLGGVTFYLRDSALFALYLAGVVLAGFPEIPNAVELNLWRYPGERFLFVQGPYQVAVAMAFLWGFICPAIRSVAKILQRLNLVPPDLR